MSELSRYLIFTEQDIGLHLETKEIFNYFLHLYGSNQPTVHGQQTSFFMMMMTDLIIKQIKAYCGCLCAYDSSHARLFEKLNNRTTTTELVCYLFQEHLQKSKYYVEARNKIDLSCTLSIQDVFQKKITFNCFKLGLI